jgi:LAO/AO transport system kinase
VTSPKDLLASVHAGDRRAVAELLTRLEVGGAGLAPLMAELEPKLKGATVLGFTGPPGAGKSTLVNELIGQLRRAGKRVAVIAVDPASPVSGGAILGDRVRMQAATGDDAVFVRSLSSRGALGGLSPAAVRLIDGLDVAGFDPILIETVGTGQNEIDVAAVADVKIVLAAPNLGDGIQAMKAGLLEIADLLVVNKADLAGADATVEQLKAAQMLATRPSVAPAPVLKTSSLKGEGVEALMATIEAIARQTLKGRSLASRRAQRLQFAIETATREALDAALRSGTVKASLVDAVATGKVALDDAVRQVLGAVQRGGA